MREQPHVYRRRRAVALAAAGALVLLAVLGLRSAGGGGAAPAGDATGAAGATRLAPAPAQLPRGGRQLFPDHRVVAFYGAPQDEQLGALGIGTPVEAAARLERQARPYARETRPVLPAFELLATIAAAAPGDDGLHRIRQDDAVIERYLRAARKARALLLLDVQPGRARFADEVRRLERWLREPDVGLALDPEWHVGPDEVPGQVLGAVAAEDVNAISAWLAGIVREERLPEKLLVVHQFTDDMIEGKERLARRPGVAVTINVDGFGGREVKRAKYADFTSEAVRFHDGFKLFYEEDVGLMAPGDVLDLRPPPDLVVYE